MRLKVRLVENKCGLRLQVDLNLDSIWPTVYDFKSFCRWINYHTGVLKKLDSRSCDSHVNGNLRELCTVWDRAQVCHSCLEPRATQCQPLFTLFVSHNIRDKGGDAYSFGSIGHTVKLYHIRADTPTRECGPIASWPAASLPLSFFRFALSPSSISCLSFICPCFLAAEILHLLNINIYCTIF